MNKRILATSKRNVAAQVPATVVNLPGEKPNRVGEGGAKIWRCHDKAVLAKLPGVAMALVLVSCQSKAPRRGVLHENIHPQADVAVNTEQARLRMRALVEPFCGALESAADQIIAGTTNHAIRREALLWKIEAVPTVRETLFHANPFMALGDTWVFLWQMAEYFQKGPGKQALGDSAPMAAAACASLEKQLTEVAGSLTRSGNVTDIRKFIEQWVADHPIQHSIASRESVVSYFTKRRLEETFSTEEAAGDFVVTMDDLSRRIDVYSGQLLDQSRWQAELFAMDLASEYQVEKAIPLAGQAVESVSMVASAADGVVGPLERLAAALETAPQLVGNERAAALQGIHEEVSRSIQFGHQELTAILDQLTKERVAAVLELHRSIAEERRAFTRDLEQLSLNVVDHAFVRTAELAAVIVLVVFAGVVVLLFLTRRLFLTKHSLNRPYRV